MKRRRARDENPLGTTVAGVGALVAVGLAGYGLYLTRKAETMQAPATTDVTALQKFGAQQTEAEDTASAISRAGGGMGLASGVALAVQGEGLVRAAGAVLAIAGVAQIAKPNFFMLPFTYAK